MAMADDIGVHFNRSGPTGGTLVVVAIGIDVYGATDREPLAALHIVARKAAEDLALRGRPVDPSAIVERGEEELQARRAISFPSPNSDQGSSVRSGRPNIIVRCVARFSDARPTARSGPLRVAGVRGEDGVLRAPPHTVPRTSFYSPTH
jgi:hypothetical protein